jgi:hypothetical protein
MIQSILYRLICAKKPVYVISHERSGTHLALNLLYRNLYINQKYLYLGDWRETNQFNHTSGEHWLCAAKSAAESIKEGGLIKSHCQQEVFSTYFPKYKYIYIVRDPRDTLVSFFYYLNNDAFHKTNPGLDDLRCSSFSDFLQRPLDEYLQYGFSTEGNMLNVVDRWARHYSRWKAYPGCPVIRYEDLKGAMRTAILKIAVMLKVMPRLWMRTYQFGEKGAILPRKGIVGDWKNHFSPGDLAFTKSVLASHGIDLAEWDSRV